MKIYKSLNRLNVKRKKSWNVNKFVLKINKMKNIKFKLPFYKGELISVLKFNFIRKGWLKI